MRLVFNPSADGLNDADFLHPSTNANAANLSAGGNLQPRGYRPKADANGLGRTGMGIMRNQIIPPFQGRDFGIRKGAPPPSLTPTPFSLSADQENGGKENSFARSLRSVVSLFLSSRV